MFLQSLEKEIGSLGLEEKVAAQTGHVAFQMLEEKSFNESLNRSVDFLKGKTDVSREMGCMQVPEKANFGN